MSFFITTEILCDHEGCGESLEGTGGHGVRKVAANKKAGKKGWLVDGFDGHFCPEHNPTVSNVQEGK